MSYKERLEQAKYLNKNNPAEIAKHLIAHKWTMIDEQTYNELHHIAENDEPGFTPKLIKSLEQQRVYL